MPPTGRVISWHIMAGNHNNPSPAKNPAGGVILRFMPQKPKSIAVLKERAVFCRLALGLLLRKSINFVACIEMSISFNREIWVLFLKIKVCLWILLELIGH